MRSRLAGTKNDLTEISNMTIEKIIRLIGEFHSDMSRSPEATLEALEKLVEEIEPMIDGLKMTIQMRE